MKDSCWRAQICALSPLHLGSGQADVTVDAEVVHDDVGLPFFPARRLKGLLYESALELVEASGEDMSGLGLATRETLDELFRHGVERDVQLVVQDFHVPAYEAVRDDLRYLEQAYGEIFRASDVLRTFSSVRYQTAIDEKGVAVRGSLHNMRVLNAGVVFEGEIRILNGEERHERLLVLALRNLRSAGMKRSRGFGDIRCQVVKDGDPSYMDRLVREALAEEAM